LRDAEIPRVGATASTAAGRRESMNNSPVNTFLDLISGLVERLGTRIAGVLLIGVGLVKILPIVFPVYVADGIGFLAVGIGLIAFGQKAQKAQQQFVASEAEKRIQNPTLLTASSVPAIQREITKQLDEPAPTTPADDEIEAAARKTPLSGTPKP
jgi:hypothetical protein